MRLKHFILPLIAFSFIWGCGSKTPPITSCLFSVEHQMFFCVDPKGVSFDMVATNALADKLACLPFNDIGIVMNYCHSLKQLKSPKDQ